MRRRFHALAGAAGALACGLVAVGWRLAAPPPCAATALVRVEADDPARDARNLSALQALAASDAVLRRAALAPDAAAAIAREARPDHFDALLTLLNARPNQTDTLGRAADMLAARVVVEPDGSAQSARIVVRMAEGEAAVLAANAVAEAIVAAHNEAVAKIDRRLDAPRRERLAQAERRHDAAHERLAALRAMDTTPVASIAPAAKAAPDPSERALADAQRGVLAAEARRAEAARIFGPRHPDMIQIETDVRRATAALQAARAKVATARPAPRGAPAEGGPDPRLAELAEAQDEVERAEASYEKAAAQFAASVRAARVVEPARAPTANERTPAVFVVGASALLGLLLFGAAPRLPFGGAPSPGSPHAVLRHGALGRAGARCVVEAMDIAASDGARRIFVHGDEARSVRDGARALGVAALAAGWKPLVVETRACGSSASGAVTLDGRAFATAPVTTRAGELILAIPTGRRRAATPDVDLAFDLVIFDAQTHAGRIDVAVWIGAGPPPERSRMSARELWIAAARDGRRDLRHAVE